jgi:hypothetical protein
MGNRAIVILTDGCEFAPEVYLHWHGSKVPQILEALRTRMIGREGDLSYSCARLVGICHEMIPSNTSLAVWPCPLLSSTAQNLAQPSVYPDETGRAIDAAAVTQRSHGDAGVFIVNVRTWRVLRFDGSQAECQAPDDYFVKGKLPTVNG